MKRMIFCLMAAGCLLVNCSKQADSTAVMTSNCGTYKNGQQLYSGPEGGCYYLSSDGKKEYVDRAACKCSLS